MIIDRLDHAVRWMTANPRITMALKALHETDLAARAPGRYDLDGDRVYAMVQTYDTKPWAGAKREAHRRYIDVQYIASGTEKMGYNPLDAIEPGTELDPFDVEKDYILWPGTGELVTFTAGMIAVFYPWDVHAPCLGVTAAGGDPVVKVVVKVAID